MSPGGGGRRGVACFMSYITANLVQLGIDTDSKRGSYGM